MPKQMKKEDRKEGKKRGKRKTKHLCVYIYICICTKHSYIFKYIKIVTSFSFSIVIYEHEIHFTRLHQHYYIIEKILIKIKQANHKVHSFITFTREKKYL